MWLFSNFQYYKQCYNTCKCNLYMCANISAGNILKVRFMSQRVNILIALIENAKLGFLGVYRLVFLQHCMKTPMSLQLLPVSVVWICTNQRGEKWVYHWNYNFHFLINKVEHSFMCLKAICLFLFFFPENRYFFLFGYWFP